MDKFIKWIWFLVLILWLPLFGSTVVCWFSPVDVGCKLTYTVLVFTILIPPVCAWLHMRE